MSIAIYCNDCEQLVSLDLIAKSAGAIQSVS
jgi:hypothetical protein